MFTQKLFNLHDFSDASLLTVKRNCEFAYVGKIPTELAPRVVACKSNKHLVAAFQETGISGVIIPEELEASIPDRFGFALCSDPIAGLNDIQRRLSQSTSGQWQSFPSRIHPSAIIMEGAYISPEDVVIEENVKVFPNAVILPRCIVGQGSSIGAGTIVGTDAFEVNTSAQPRQIVPQSGGVRIGRHVDIQAKCTIVRATFGGFTEIDDETKFDCQVHFAHDCRTGRRVRIAACAEISGRVTIGEDSFIAPNVSITNGIRIGRNCHVTIGAVVTQDIGDNERVTGNFAVEHGKWLKFIRSIR